VRTWHSTGRECSQQHVAEFRTGRRRGEHWLPHNDEASVRQRPLATDGDRAIIEAEMRITIRASSRWVTRLARRRFVFALSRFRHRVRTLAVRVTDVNGPRGGLDKRCRVTVQLQGPSQTVVIDDVDADAAIAVDRAADRTARTVARATEAASGWRTLQRA
jgi:putative sigma-54 modulation protein